MLNIGFLSHYPFLKTLFPSFLHHLCLQFLYPTNFLVRECFSLLILGLHSIHMEDSSTSHCYLSICSLERGHIFRDTKSRKYHTEPFVHEIFVCRCRELLLFLALCLLLHSKFGPNRKGLIQRDKTTKRHLNAETEGYVVRGGSRISEKGGLLINIHEAGEGVWGGAPAANAYLLYHAHNLTLHNVMILPCRLFARRAAVVRISAIFTSQ